MNLPIWLLIDNHYGSWQYILQQSKRGAFRNRDKLKEIFPRYPNYRNEETHAKAIFLYSAGNLHLGLCCCSRQKTVKNG